jgi:hypothetical protein
MISKQSILFFTLFFLCGAFFTQNINSMTDIWKCTEFGSIKSNDLSPFLYDTIWQNQEIQRLKSKLKLVQSNNDELKENLEIAHQTITEEITKNVTLTNRNNILNENTTACALLEHELTVNNSKLIIDNFELIGMNRRLKQKLKINHAQTKKLTDKNKNLEEKLGAAKLLIEQLALNHEKFYATKYKYWHLFVPYACLNAFTISIVKGLEYLFVRNNKASGEEVKYMAGAAIGGIIISSLIYMGIQTNHKRKTEKEKQNLVKAKENMKDPTNRQAFTRITNTNEKWVKDVFFEE